MSSMSRIIFSLSVASLLLAGCAPKTVDYDVRIITVACALDVGDPSLDPMKDVTHFRIRLTGEGLERIEKTSAVSLGELKLPEIPAGAARQLEVRAYVGDPSSGGTLWSLGRSLPFDVPDVAPQNVPKQPEIPLFLRKVNAFTPPSSVEKPGTCTRMRDGRAGHTATLLKDGRVFIAGGYQLNASKRSAISKAEIYNPALGDFIVAQELGFVSPNQIAYPSPRAFHTATTLSTGQILLIGGETYTDRGDAAPVKLGLLYDADFNDYGVFPLLVERTRHAMAKDTSDRVLIVGGTDKNGALIESMEWYDPTQSKMLPVLGNAGAPIPLPRVGHSMGAVQGGAFLAVAGGSNGSQLQDEVHIYKFEGDRFVNAVGAQNPRLNEKRRAAAMVPFQDSNRLLLAGGFDSATEASGGPIATTEILETGLSFQLGEGPVVGARGEICAAQLPDGRVITIGGLVNDPVAGARSDASVEMLAPSPAGPPTILRMDPLSTARHFHTCTALKDGTVLVLGGVTTASGQSSTLQDALIFTPTPLD